MNYPTIDPSTAPSTLGLPSRGSILRRLSLGALSCSCILALAPALMTSQALADDESASFWTDFIPSTDTRLVFVSSSEGNDSNTGYTADSPVKTLAKGYALLRDGSPDWMLLKRGDTWNEPLPVWDKSGRSETEIMIVGAYGDEIARPQIRPDSQSGIRLIGRVAVEHLAFVGMHIEPMDRQTDEMISGILMLKNVDDILFEDIYIDNWGLGMNLQAYDGAVSTDIRLNGCVIVDSWSATTHSQGIFAQGLDGLMIENSVIDHNGYNEEIEDAPATLFNHNLYINNGTKNVVLRKNIIANASSHGIQLRPGGIIEDNLFISNPLAVLFGGGTQPEEDGVTGRIARNIILNGRGITPAQPRSFGITASNISQATISANIFCNSEINYNGSPIMLAGDRDLMLNNLTIEHNSIANWNGSVSVHNPAPGQTFSNIIINNNNFFGDFTANNGNGNFNKSFITLFAEYESSVSIADNSYKHFGMHNRPFLIGNTNVSSDEWLRNHEPSAEIQSSEHPPSEFTIKNFMESVDMEGGIEEFIAHARNQSRHSEGVQLSSVDVYGWFAESLSE